MIRGVRLVVFGKQGAGKGTQCVRLARHYVVPHISTGDMFRTAVSQQTEWGKLAKKYMDEGELVPDEVTIGIVRERFQHDDTRQRGFVLDGFPRTVGQAEALEGIMTPNVLDLAIDLEISTEVALRRLAGRRVCDICGANYSVEVPPKYDWTCDTCGGDVVQRADDTEAAIRRRLEIYESDTAPLIVFFMERDRLASVDGSGPTDVVFGRLVGTIDRRLSPEAG